MKEIFGTFLFALALAFLAFLVGLAAPMKLRTRFFQARVK